MQPENISNNVRIPNVPELHNGQWVEGGEFMPSSEIFARCKDVILDAFSNQESSGLLELRSHEIREIFTQDFSEVEFVETMPKLVDELCLKLDLDETGKSRLMDILQELEGLVLQQEEGELKEIEPESDSDNEISGKLYNDVSEVGESREGEQKTVRSTAIIMHTTSVSTLIPHYTPVIPSCLLLYRWRGAFLCIDTHSVNHFSPEVASKVAGIVPPYPAPYTPAQQKWIVVNDGLTPDQIRLIPVEKLRSTWRKDRPVLAFTSINNRPNLLQEEFEKLVGPHAALKNSIIVGYLDARTDVSNRFEIKLLTDSEVKIPSSYVTCLSNGDIITPTTDTPGAPAGLAPAPTAAATGALAAPAPTATAQVAPAATSTTSQRRRPKKANFTQLP